MFAKHQIGLGVSLLAFFAASACGGGGKDTTNFVPAKPGFVALEVTVTAAKGADIAIPGGARLNVPAGALDSDTKIRILVPADQSATSRFQRFKMEPSGLAFRQPATLVVPYVDTDDGGEPLISAWQASPVNPLQHLGTSELSNTLPLEPLARDEAGNLVSFRVDHFTFFLVGIRVDEMTYLVKHIPPRYLGAGDLLFTLTGGGMGKLGAHWQPGHVAIFTGGGEACQAAFRDELIEATPPPRLKDANGIDLPEDAVDKLARILQSPGVVKSTLASFISDATHIYLGARRPAGAALTLGERAGVASYATAQLGRPYNLVMGQDNVAPDGFSCVGLSEAAYDSINRGSLGAVAEGLIPTPIELFSNTVPVSDVVVGVGESYEMPVHGVVVHPASPSTFLTLRGSYCPSYPCAAADASHSVLITAKTNPVVNAAMTLGADGHYTWSFTPGPELANQFVDVQFEMSTSPLSVTGPFDGRVAVSAPTRLDSLRVHVVPCAAQTPRCPAEPPNKAVVCHGAGPAAVAPFEAVFLSFVLGGFHGNSNPFLPFMPIDGEIDLFGLAAMPLDIDAETLLAAFGNTTFPCGPGPSGLTLCPAAGSLGPAGEWVVAQTTLAAAVPSADPTWSFQYGFVFDADGDATNNYQPSPMYADDYYQGTDRWYSAEYNPTMGWKLKVSDARNGQIKDVPSGARLVVRDRWMTLFVPRAELPAAKPGLRVTAFRHKGDYGQTAPHIYGADTHPPVRMPLYPVVP